jgi:hypothetical protein
MSAGRQLLHLDGSALAKIYAAWFVIDDIFLKVRALGGYCPSSFLYSTFPSLVFFFLFCFLAYGCLPVLCDK